MNIADNDRAVVWSFDTARSAHRSRMPQERRRRRRCRRSWSRRPSRRAPRTTSPSSSSASAGPAPPSNSAPSPHNILLTSCLRKMSPLPIYASASSGRWRGSFGAAVTLGVAPRAATRLRGSLSHRPHPPHPPTPPCLTRPSARAHARARTHAYTSTLRHTPPPFLDALFWTTSARRPPSPFLPPQPPPNTNTPCHPCRVTCGDTSPPPLHLHAHARPSNVLAGTPSGLRLCVSGFRPLCAELRMFALRVCLACLRARTIFTRQEHL
jgi:hypothetical protein